MNEFWENYGPLIIAGGILLATIILAVVVSNRSEKEWAEFSAAHECRIIGKKNGDLIPVVSPNGMISFGVSSDTTGWACNDGLTYWR